MRLKLNLALIALCAVAFSGCGTLDPSGPYKGDRILYDADYTIATSYEVIHSFVKWEYDNRAGLASNASIKQSADKIRQQAPKSFAAAIALRDAYAANPTSSNRDALQNWLKVLHQMVIEATAFLATQASLEK